MAETTRVSPLAHRDPVAPGPDSAIAISEVTDRAMIDLRARIGDADATAALEKALGFTLPTAPRSSSSHEERAALWMSVDQWLITAPLGERGRLCADLDKASARVFAAVTDLSDARAVIRLEGAGVREIIMKGAGADLTGPDGARGTVRRMRFAEIAAMIHIVEIDPDVIDLYVFRSYADYAWDWIAEAARPAAMVKLYTAQETPPV